MLRLRELRLRAITAEITFGADLPFSPGLNVIQAGNTSGKSTCLQAIIFALGLERSLGPQLNIPLPYAMRERIHERADAPYKQVLQSYVELEIENANGDVVTVRRDIVGGADSKLIKTWSHVRHTAGNNDHVQRDYFVHDSGAAQREDGFHTFLERFMDWHLPEVTRFDGTDCPLYIETIFPLIFVEQKRGWSAIQGPFPTFFRIQDTARRAMEFLMDLDAGRIRRERTELRRDIALYEQRWAGKVAELQERSGFTYRFKGIPDAPTAEFAHNASIELEVFDEEWRPVHAAVAIVRQRIAELEGIAIPETESSAPEVEEELNDAKSRMAELTAVLETLQQDFNTHAQEKVAIEKRLSTLHLDLKRNQDALKLQRLGSVLGTTTADHTCPTCHQEVAAELLPTTSSAGMAIDENILFLKSQIDLYTSTLRGMEASMRETRSNYHALTEKLKRVRRRIRELRESLVQPSSSLSRARIEEIVQLQNRYDHFSSLQQSVDELTDELRVVATQWAQLHSRLKEISGPDLSASDEQKIDDLRTTIRTHLDRYGFRSFQTNEIDLADDSFRPLVRTKDEEGRLVERELGFEVSASDAIRLKWAYYLALLLMPRAHSTNHPGLLILDEPGQQEIEPESFSAFLHWAAANTKDQQLILGTSEKRSLIESAVGKHDYKLISFDGLILKPIRG